MDMTGTDANQLLPDLDRLRARVRADRRATSTPMLAFGALILTYAAIVGVGAGHLQAAGRHSTLLLYWPLATAVGLVALWWSERRRAGQDGVGEGQHTYRSATRAYLAGLTLSAVLFIPALFIVLFIGVFTPMVWPAAVFAALAAWQRNRLLGAWAAAIGVLGGAESVYVIADNGLNPTLWWLQPVVHTALGLALVTAGLVISRRERAAT
jgi:hypothetical protein